MSWMHGVIEVKDFSDVEAEIAIIDANGWELIGATPAPNGRVWLFVRKPA